MSPALQKDSSPPRFPHSDAVTHFAKGLGSPSSRIAQSQAVTHAASGRRYNNSHFTFYKGYVVVHAAKDQDVFPRVFFFFFFTLVLSSFWTSRGHRCRPLSPPRFMPSIFIAHRVQHSHCSSIFHRVLPTHALALSASQFVHKKKPPRIYTSMHSGGFELTKLTYTRLEDNLIRHLGDRLYTASASPQLARG